MIKYVLLFGVVLSSSAAITQVPKKGATDGNRFLFVVDTSRTMKRIEDAGKEVAFNLVHSGIENRMQAGDTFGVWTFSEGPSGTTARH